MSEPKVYAYLELHLERPPNVPDSYWKPIEARPVSGDVFILPWSPMAIVPEGEIVSLHDLINEQLRVTKIERGYHADTGVDVTMICSYSKNDLDLQEFFRLAEIGFGIDENTTILSVLREAGLPTTWEEHQKSGLPDSYDAEHPAQD